MVFHFFINIKKAFKFWRPHFLSYLRYLKQKKRNLAYHGMEGQIGKSTGLCMSQIAFVSRIIFFTNLNLFHMITN